jgi:hypothetical protein
MTPPSPLSVLLTANPVADGMGDHLGTESFLNANGCDRMKSSTAVKYLVVVAIDGALWLAG